MLQGRRLALQPARESVNIVQRGLAKAEGVADLCPMIHARPAAPVVSEPGFGRYVDLAGDRRDRRERNLFQPVRKPPVSSTAKPKRVVPALLPSRKRSDAVNVRRSSASVSSMLGSIVCFCPNQSEYSTA
jgi:hypothetical protein